MASQHLQVERKYNYEHDLPIPTIVGYFSIDKNRQFLPTFENLKYFYKYPQQVEFDLNDGYESSVLEDRNKHNDEKLDFILKWIDHNLYFDKLFEDEIFVCNRGLLAQIMRTPYEESEGFIVCAEKVRNVIFLYSFDTEETKRSIQNQSDGERSLTYYGFKFEQYLLSDEPGKKPITSLPVNSNEKFQLVYENKFNNHKILFAAEVDGIVSKLPANLKLELDQHKLKPNQFIELKTLFERQTYRHGFKKYKTLKWWTQSNVAGIENITCGFRTLDGLVYKLQDYNTNTLPCLGQEFWNTRVCRGFLDDFLTFVRDKLRHEKDYTRWIFRWSALEPFVSAEKGRENDEFDLLPEWFVQICAIW